MTGEEREDQDDPSAGAERPALDERARFYFWSHAFRTIHHIVSAGMWVAIAYFAFQAVETLAGKSTSIWASLSVVKSSYGLPWVLAAILAVWALSERKLRQRKTTSMESHIRELEAALDPERTSSELLPTGQTNPKDK